MKTSLGSISKAQMSELISDGGLGKLDDSAMATMERWIKASLMVWSGVNGERLLCIWGLVPPTLLSDQAYLWLYTTEAAHEFEFALVRRSQIEVRKMLKLYPKIIGHCEAHASRSIRWLKWLGATFGEVEGKLIPFTIRQQGA